MIDIHNHLIPGVDDGAAGLEEARAALETMHAQGVRGVITTPHGNGAHTTSSDELDAFLGRIDPAWEKLKGMAAVNFPELRVERGLELMLDIPTPDLSDPRTRLAGTAFVLIEFSHSGIPPNSVDAIFRLKMNGWIPVIAHPERYAEVDELRLVEGWRRAGAFLQLNCGSIVGRYGPQACARAWRLLGEGCADFLSSDYHARGRCSITEARVKLEESGGEEQAHLLMEANPGRLLEGELPVPVTPLKRTERSPWYRNLLRRGR
ncbi:MAG: hypothetical protein GEU90_00430 [Gemmatimonas sp.]|nr:hypothetical protein [Gemmatimonas sp.]